MNWWFDILLPKFSDRRQNSWFHQYGAVNFTPSVTGQKPSRKFSFCLSPLNIFLGITEMFLANVRWAKIFLMRSYSNFGRLGTPGKVHQCCTFSPFVDIMFRRSPKALEITLTLFCHLFMNSFKYVTFWDFFSPHHFVGLVLFKWSTGAAVTGTLASEIKLSLPKNTWFQFIRDLTIGSYFSTQGQIAFSLITLMLK